MLILIIGMLAIGGGVYIAMENASIARKQIQTNTRRASAYAMITPGEEELAKSARERLLLPMFDRLAEIAMRMSPSSKRMELQRKLRNAGTDAKPHTLLTLKGGFCVAGIGAMVIGLFGDMMPLLIIGLVLFMIGFLGPDFWLNSRIRSRREEMERMLPDTLDLLTV
ncbi:MAG: hypothetical protein ABI200_05540, partial [Gaiellales bacterium]